MSEWAAKRFWKTVSVTESEAGFGIALDGRPVRTPGKSRVEVPTRAFADVMVAEWEAQTKAIDPLSMPATRLANSAIEKVSPRQDEVIDHLLGYGASDLLCYRAEQPASLVAREREFWDPWIEWASDRFDVHLKVTEGIIPVEQDGADLRKLRAALEGFDAFELAAVHELVTLPGSLILGLAAAEGADTPDAIWQTARVDELWQAEQWGIDDEAEAVSAARAEDFARAAQFLGLLGKK